MGVWHRNSQFTNIYKYATIFKEQKHVDFAKNKQTHRTREYIC